jgi:galactose mutarotase-like enzyme
VGGGCRIDEHWGYRGLTCIRFENEHIGVDLVPDLGGHIHRFVDKARDHDVLWHSPRVPLHRAELHANFDDHWSGGWDEAFPNGVPGPNRYGDQLAYMGEVWTAPCEWEVAAGGPNRVELVLRFTTPITPARWERRYVLEAGSPVLRVQYRVENVGTMPFDFNWGIHPAQAITTAHRFDAPASHAEVDENGGGTLGVKGDRYEWPTFGELDVRRPLGPDAACFALHYLTGLSDGWVAITDTAAKRGFGLVFDPQVFPVIWLWMVYGGWRGYYHAIMEPWTGHPSDLAEAAHAGRARELRPGESLQTQVAAVVYGGVESVSRLEADGSVAQ